MLLGVRFVDGEDEVVVRLLSDVGAHGPPIKDEHPLEFDKQTTIDLLCAERLIALSRFEKLIKKRVSNFVLTLRVLLKHFLSYNSSTVMCAMPLLRRF